MTTEKQISEIEKASDVLIDSICKSKALIKAIRELGQMEEIADHDLLTDPVELKKPENWNAFTTISEIIRAHDTVSELARILRDELDKIDEASELIEETLIAIKYSGLTLTDNGEAS